MIAAVLEDGVVVNLIVVESIDGMQGMVDGEGAQLGDTWDGAAFVKPASPPPPSIDDLATQYSVAVQRMLDETAQSFGYDSIAAAVTYADEPAVPRFQEEGRGLRAWRSLVWAKCYEMLAHVEAGTAPIPSESDVMAALPAAPVQEAY